MNCCIKLVNWPSPQSVHHHASFFFLYADGKRHSCLPVCGTCVWSCAQIPEKHRAKPCFALQTKTLLVSLDMGWESWKGGGGAVRGFASCQLCQSPSQQIVCVSWGMEREALLWFWSTDQCQAWKYQVDVVKGRTVVVGGGVKGLGRPEFKWRRLLPPVVP